MVKLLHPQEVEVFYLLPAVRRELALRWKKKGKTQKGIAKLLGVTDAAVSQYLSAKRAKALESVEEINKALDKAAESITNHESLIKETQNIMRLLWKHRIICKLHAEFGEIPEGCNACFENEIRN